MSLALHLGIRLRGLGYGEHKSDQAGGWPRYDLPTCHARLESMLSFLLTIADFAITSIKRQISLAAV
jgi:hypothetical protein